MFSGKITEKILLRVAERCRLAELRFLANPTEVALRCSRLAEYGSEVFHFCLAAQTFLRQRTRANYFWLESCCIAPCPSSVLRC